MLDGGPRIAQVVAEEPTTCLAIASWDFERVLRDEPGVALAVLRVVAARLRDGDHGPPDLTGSVVTAAERSSSPPSLPTGTVTFLFTDIEGSTRRVAELGDAAWGELLAVEGRLIADASIAEGGVPFGTEGDAHFVAFPTAGAGIRAAVAAQRALAAHAVAGRRRSASGWGSTPARRSSSPATTSGSRSIAPRASPRRRTAARSSCLDPTRVLAGDHGDGITFRDLGEHRLKDLPRPERVYQVEAPGLERDFPPLRSLDATPNNLPLQLTSFVGPGRGRRGGRPAGADAAADAHRARAAPARPGCRSRSPPTSSPPTRTACGSCRWPRSRSRS